MILLLTAPPHQRSHEFMALANGWCLCHSGGLILLANSLILGDAVGISAQFKEGGGGGNPTWELAFPHNVLREEEYVICEDLFPN